MPKSSRDLPWAVACPTNHNLRDIAFIGLRTPRLLWNNNVAQGRSESRVFMEKRVKSAVGIHRSKSKRRCTRHVTSAFPVVLNVAAAWVDNESRLWNEKIGYFLLSLFLF